MLEAKCGTCGETFTPADESDVEHVDCGGATTIVAVWLELPDVALDHGWGNDYVELAASLKATLSEIVGDDGVPYVPKFNGISVGEDGSWEVGP